ncbi:TonB-dependent receptor [Corallincola spongiicola]|uniref:TonB-dependent receptor n=1 Tax=Corallincola spongiicola TaxID=2520508 RepID=A0ABY1WTK0_9GAMM|nr:TonB-dependent receptor [Corallincola spongiicola]TAA48071.1 TonB-dependent receptor [Corallincola spongiicola]
MLFSTLPRKTKLAAAIITTLGIPLPVFSAAPTVADEDIEHIKVTSSFRSESLQHSASSITVLDSSLIQDEGGEHFEDLLHNVANLSWAGGSSRPKYFQIRGVGEQEEYQGAPNSSVGFVVDDIDLSGLGMTSSLYDIEQVEVLRGPQGTRFGANALAGMIYTTSNDPTDTREFGAEISGGQEDLFSYAGFASGPVDNSGDLLYRVSIQQHNENGFRDNDYLGSDDSNERDELTLRSKFRWFASDELQVDLALLYANFDNGYDAWTLDNNGFTTLTDQPGKDKQETTGGSLKLNWELNEFVDLVSISSAAHTNHRHAYDGDWANPEYWSALSCTDYYDENGNGDFTDQIPCQYDYTWDKQATRDTYTQEVRLLSTEESRLFSGTTDWLTGLYIQRLEEDNDLESYYNGFPDLFLQSDYEATSIALFGQLDTQLNAATSLSLGLRVEQRDASYDDDGGDSFDPDETMWGGHITLNYLINERWQSYGKLARGYKAGGFNTGLPDDFSDNREFDSETLDNLEFGIKGYWPEQQVSVQAALFYMHRDDQQVEASTQDPNNPQRFFLYTANATNSDSYGLELETSWQATDNLTLYSSLGLLDTEFDDYVVTQADGSELDLSGRELAHSPNYQFSIGATWRNDEGWFANINLNGSDGYYYSDNHDQKADSYELLNARLGYEKEDWSVYLWGRNITDEKYGVRGFYFGNEPDQDWAPKLYERYGDPQQFGVTFRYHYL